MTQGKGSFPRVARVIAGVLLIATMAVRSSAAAELEGVDFADQVRAGDVTMRLSCVGLLRYKLFIKAYVAAREQLRAADGGSLVVVNEALGDRREIPLAK